MRASPHDASFPDLGSGRRKSKQDQFFSSSTGSVDNFANFVGKIKKVVALFVRNPVNEMDFVEFAGNIDERLAG